MDMIPIGLSVVSVASLAANCWQRTRLKEANKKAKGYDTYITRLVSELEELKRLNCRVERELDGLSHRERIANEKLDKINHLLNPLGTVCQGFLDGLDELP